MFRINFDIWICWHLPSLSETKALPPKKTTSGSIQTLQPPPIHCRWMDSGMLKMRLGEIRFCASQTGNG